MPRFDRLRTAGVLAALGAVVTVACGTETIDLLPLAAGGSAGGAEASPQSGSSSAGTDAGSGGASAGNAGSSAGSGASTAAGYGGRVGGCGGYGCGGFGGFGGNGFGGAVDMPPCTDNNPIWCSHCADDKECRTPMFGCNKRVGICLPACDNALNCGRDHVCDPTYKTCAPCFNDDQCVANGVPERRTCEVGLGRCVECNDRVPCAPPDRCAGFQCVECTGDKDCKDGRTCDEIKGRCQ